MRPSILTLVTLVTLAAVSAASPLASAPLRAQAVLDDGSFTLYVNGERIGREQFSIRRADIGTRPALLARATVTLGPRRLESTLRADTTGQPIEFLFEEHRDGRIALAARGEVSAGRFAQRVSSQDELSEREVRLLPGTVVFDDETIHQYYFVGRVPPGGGVRVLVPRRLGRDSLAVRLRSPLGVVELGNGTAVGTHLIVVNAAGVATDVWFDDRGRLLRVAVESRGFVAVRDEPPG